MDMGEHLLASHGKADKLYGNICKAAVKEYQLTPNEVVVLNFLSSQSRFDTAKDLVKFHGISKGLVCRSVESLVSRGYLETDVDQKDRRVIHLKIKEDAKKIVKQLEAAREEFFGKLFDGVSKEEMAVIQQVMDKMVRNIEKENE